MPVNFFNIDNKNKIRQKNAIRNWIIDILNSYKKTPGEINIILTSDPYLLQLSIDHLSRNYLTDIITFNFNDESYISGDLYISLDRVKENAEEYNVTDSDELLRVIIHGVLHLLDFKDQNAEQRLTMRSNEDLALKKIKVSNII